MKAPAVLALLAGGAAVAFSAPPLASRPLDPPAPPGAMAPNVALEGDDVLLTWIEAADPGPRAGKARRLRFSRLSGDHWSTPVTIAAGPALLANWADFPGVSPSPDGSLVAH